MGFKDIIGQENAIRCVKTAFQQDRLAHAYLFYGTAGVGKETTALAFAKWLNCPNRTEHDACNTCPTCRKIASYNHPDIKLIFPRPSLLKTEDIQEIIKQKAANPDVPIRFDKNVSIVVEDIREMQKQLTYPPFEAKTRVIIIREVEKMHVVTANALLKTLEEPPDRTMLILTSNHVHSLLQTILSRCQKVRFRDLKPAEIEQALIARDGLPSTLARLLGQLANGSLGDVIGVEEAALFAQRQAVMDALSLLAKNDNFALIAQVNAWLKNKSQLGHQLNILSVVYRDLMILHLNLPTETYLTNMDLADQLRPFASRISAAGIEASIREINEARGNLLRNVNPHLTLLHLFFSLRRNFEGTNRA